MQVLCACDSVLAVLVLVLAVLAVRVRVVAVAVRVVAVAVRVLAVLVMLVVRVVRVVLVVLVVTVRVVLVLMSLVLTVTMLVVAMLMHAMTVLVVAMRMIVLVSQVRLLVPKCWHKHLAKSMAQQIAADKHAPGLFLRLVARNCPRAFYQVKFDPLITARQRTLCARKLSKHASRSRIQKPNQMRWTWKLGVSESHSLQVRPFVLLASWIFKNRTVKRASQKTIPPLVGNISIRRLSDNLCLRIHLCRKLLNGLGSILATWSKLGNHHARGGAQLIVKNLWEIGALILPRNGVDHGDRRQQTNALPSHLIHVIKNALQLSYASWFNN